MSEARSQRRIGRSIAALLAGVITDVVLSAGTDSVLQSIGVFPRLGQPMASPLLLLALAYRTAYGIAGSYVVAWLAPNRPMGHAIVFGIVGLVISTVGVIATWNGGPAYEPKWYPLALVATALPCAWAGGRLYQAHQA